MTKNEQVAAALGMKECAAEPGNTCRDSGCTFWYGPDDEEYEDLPDYVNDIAVAMTLVSGSWQLNSDPVGKGVAATLIFDCKASHGFADTASAALVEAFLDAKGTK